MFELRIAGAGQDRYQAQHRRVFYDRSTVIEQLKSIGHPGRAYLIKHLSDEW
jgi:hypothetical protein